MLFASILPSKMSIRVLVEIWISRVVEQRSKGLYLQEPAVSAMLQREGSPPDAI
jgi:hypothetical protein